MRTRGDLSFNRQLVVRTVSLPHCPIACGRRRSSCVHILTRLSVYLFYFSFSFSITIFPWRWRRHFVAVVGRIISALIISYGLPHRQCRYIRGTSPPRPEPNVSGGEQSSSVAASPLGSMCHAAARLDRLAAPRSGLGGTEFARMPRM